MNTRTLSSGHCRRSWAPALPVDVEQVVLAVLERAVDGVDRGAVAAAVDHRPLGELAALDHSRELVLGDELVVDAIPLAGRGARVVYETENSSRSC